GGERAEGGREGYGFAAPCAKATMVWAEQGKEKKRLSRTLEFGIEIPGTDSTAARVVGTDRIFFIPTSVANAAKKSPDELKSKEAFGGSSAEAVRLDVERGRGRLTLSRKNGTSRITQPF